MPAKKTKFQLNAANYFSSDRPHVSSSQLADYLRCPDYYFRKHVKHDPELQTVPTPSMKRGTLVDDLLTSGRSDIQKKVLQKEDRDLFAAQKGLSDEFLLEAGMYDQAIRLFNVLKEHPHWLGPDKGSVKAEHQTILEDRLEGFKSPICGKLDRILTYRLEEQTVIDVIDLKVTTSANMRDARKWLYTVIDRYYHVQAFLYSYLAQAGDPLASIRFFHVVASIEDGVVTVKRFAFPESLIAEGERLVRKALAGIEAKDWGRREYEEETLPYVGEIGFGD